MGHEFLSYTTPLSTQREEVERQDHSKSPALRSQSRSSTETIKHPIKCRIRGRTPTVRPQVRFLARLRNGIRLMVGRPVEVLPTRPEDLEALGIAMGFKDQPRQELEEAYLRATRVTCRIARPLIYGQEL